MVPLTVDQIRLGDANLWFSQMTIVNFDFLDEVYVENACISNTNDGGWSTSRTLSFDFGISMKLKPKEKSASDVVAKLKSW